MTPPSAPRRGPAPSPYFEDLLDEVRRTRIAIELIAESLGHLIPLLIEEEQATGQ